MQVFCQRKTVGDEPGHILADVQFRNRAGQQRKERVFLSPIKDSIYVVCGGDATVVELHGIGNQVRLLPITDSTLLNLGSAD